jgi:alkaline phosphatase D
MGEIVASLRAPGLGPIVGHTTDTTCRIWIRAGDPADDKAILDKDRRTVGVIGIVGKGKSPKIIAAWYFRLQREFDRTGIFTLGSDRQLGWYPSDFKDAGKPEPAKLPPGIQSEPLTPNTAYTVRVGTLTIDDPLPDDESMPDWKLRDRLPKIEAIQNELLTLKATESEAVFRTFPKSGQIASDMAFVLGSCRYPGLLWKIKEADRIFGPLAAHFDPKRSDPARFTVMCGDQIYADTLNKSIPLLRADTYEEFQERYRSAFGSPNLRRLLRTSTNYMIIDDHEIEDNWTQDRLRNQGSHVLFNMAISAYMSYQWSHSPRTWGRLLYYAFACGGYPVFMLDTRTQRYKDDQIGLRDNHLLGRPSLDPVNHPGQLQSLLTWLSAQQKEVGDAPKFIVSSSVFLPNAMDERIDPVADDKPATTPGDEIYLANANRRGDSDSWPAYPNTRRDLLKHIVDNKIQNVIFLSGDIHCSCIAEIAFDGAQAKDLKAFSVVSSAFYWPFPFADGDPNGFVHDSRVPGQADPFPIQGTDTVMHYRTFGFTQEDNFNRLDIDRSKSTITVRVFDRDGAPLAVPNANGVKTTANVLQLAKW